jgi:BMFP domain-containing protein YqiC
MTMSIGDDQYAAQEGDTNLPIPDPTRLTTQLVDRALAAFREVVFTRLGGMDRATELVADELKKLQADTAEQHEHLRQDRREELASAREFILSQLDTVARVSNEKFTAITTQFAERDTRTEQAAQESRISLDAALAAAKEAVSEQNKANALAIGKSEDATKERLDALALLMTTSVSSLDDKISDVKSRLDRGEGHTSGGIDARALMFAVVGLLVGAAGVALGLLR